MVWRARVPVCWPHSNPEQCRCTTSWGRVRQVASTSFNKLLNRLLAVRVDMQQKIFAYFTAFQVTCRPSHPTKLWR